jgi:purine-binding chemotaxis protein CheW
VATADAYVLFELAGTAYALPSGAVQRLEMVEHVTPVPNAPQFVDGVVFSRGQVVPAVNLRRRFGFERAEFDLKTRLIIAAHTGRSVGLIVDSAREFVTISAEAIQPPPEALAGTSGNYVTGITTLNDKVVLILDVAAVLSHAVGIAPTPVAPHRSQ